MRNLLKTMLSVRHVSKLVDDDQLLVLVPTIRWVIMGVALVDFCVLAASSGLVWDRILVDGTAVLAAILTWKFKASDRVVIRSFLVSFTLSALVSILANGGVYNPSFLQLLFVMTWAFRLLGPIDSSLGFGGILLATVASLTGHLQGWITVPHGEAWLIYYASNVLILLVIEGIMLSLVATSRTRLSQHQQAMMESAPGLVLVTDLRDGKILYFGGMDHARFEGVQIERIHDLVPSSESELLEKMLDFWREQEGADLSVPSVIQMRVADGVLRMFKCYTRIFEKDSHGQARLIVTQGIDVSELVEMNEESARHRRQVDALDRVEILGHLSGAVAHDFNNLLTPIQGYATLLQRRLPPGDPRADMAAEIESAAGRAKQLSRQLLNLTRGLPMEQKPIELCSFITAFTDLLRRTLRENIRVDLELPDEPCLIRGDPSDLERALLNLGLNAQDAMPDGGELFIRVSMARGRRLAEICVTDTGGGIPKEVLPHIFEPFFSTKEHGRGTGLGLLSTRQIISRHNGRISAGNDAKGGARFCIELPRVDEEAPPALTKTAEPDARGKGRVLLVEDNLHVREFISYCVRELGYQVLEAASAEDAVAVIRATPDWIPDLLLSDVMLPGLHGPGLYQQLAGKFPGLKVIFMTGYTQTELKRVKITGEHRVLHKPVGVNEIGEAIRDLMAEVGKISP